MRSLPDAEGLTLREWIELVIERESTAHNNSAHVARLTGDK